MQKNCPQKVTIQCTVVMDCEAIRIGITMMAISLLSAVRERFVET